MAMDYHIAKENREQVSNVKILKNIYLLESHPEEKHQRRQARNRKQVEKEEEFKRVDLVLD